tara:strand:+ start:394 stop:786 length:393 start_codon:yes stop_codon:yes gene_type:complete
MPANIKNKGKKYGKSGMVAYKYGGRKVPGMFKAQTGFGDPGSRPAIPTTRFNPYTHFKTEQDYNAWVNSGSPDINTYVPPRNPNIFNMRTPRPDMGSMDRGIPPTRPVDTTKVKKPIIKRGGSTGPNGML